MTRQKQIILATVMALLAVTAIFLSGFRNYQKLGKPGVVTRPIPGSNNLEVVLPEQVLDYHSESVEQSPVVVETLPKDTSFGQRLYHGPDGSWIQVNVVLMGADRTSMHKPQICMPGGGISIDRTEIISIPIKQPQAYDLSVIKLEVSKAVSDAPDGIVHGIFIYWYVADGQVSADPSALRRMWLSSKNLLLKGELQRWAYVTCFRLYRSGDEEVCLDEMKSFLAAAIPRFQKYPKPDQIKQGAVANR